MRASPPFTSLQAELAVATDRKLIVDEISNIQAADKGKKRMGLVACDTKSSSLLPSDLGRSVQMLLCQSSPLLAGTSGVVVGHRF